MFNIFKELEDTSTNSGISRVNAQNYLNKVSEAMVMIIDLHHKNKTKVEVKKLISTDTIAETRPFNINGKQVSFKMAFNHGSALPYAAEIIKEIEND